MSVPDLYSLLGVPENATETQIKRAFKAITKEWHPDVSKHPDATEKFKMFRAAYEILMDPEKRAEYEEDVRKQEEKELNSYTFDGMYSSLFSSPASGRQPIDGENIHVTVEFDVNDVFNGHTKKIRIKRNRTCPECVGKGYTGGKGNCAPCHGRGVFYKTISTPFGKIQSVVVCETCAGHGILQTAGCNTCRSSGVIPEDVVIDVPITRKTYHNQKTRRVGQGQPGRRGGVAGDINIHFKFTDRSFALRQDMLETKQHVLFSDWLQNKPVDIQLPDGTTQTIPLGRFENGQTVWIADYGLFNPKNSMFEALAVTLAIKMPTWSEEECRKIIEVLNSGSVYSSR